MAVWENPGRCQFECVTCFAPGLLWFDRFLCANYIFSLSCPQRDRSIKLNQSLVLAATVTDISSFITVGVPVMDEELNCCYWMNCWIIRSAFIRFSGAWRKKPRNNSRNMTETDDKKENRSNKNWKTAQKHFDHLYCSTKIPPSCYPWPPPPFQIKLYILLSCCSLLRNSPLRSNHNYRKESFEIWGGGWRQEVMDGFSAPCLHSA